jgi:hypothetical protein
MSRVRHHAAQLPASRGGVIDSVEQLRRIIAVHASIQARRYHRLPDGPTLDADMPFGAPPDEADAVVRARHSVLEDARAGRPALALSERRHRREPFWAAPQPSCSSPDPPTAEEADRRPTLAQSAREAGCRRRQTQRATGRCADLRPQDRDSVRT